MEEKETKDFFKDIKKNFRSPKTSEANWKDLLGDIKERLKSSPVMIVNKEAYDKNKEAYDKRIKPAASWGTPILLIEMKLLEATNVPDAIIQAVKKEGYALLVMEGKVEEMGYVPKEQREIIANKPVLDLDKPHTLH